MTVRRWLPPVAVLVAAGAVVAGGLAVPVPESVLDQPQTETSVVTGTTHVCPTPLDVAEATTLVQAWTLPDPGVPTSGLDGQPLRYNCQDSLFSPNFYAIGDSAHPLWRQLLQAPVGK